MAAKKKAPPKAAPAKAKGVAKTPQKKAAPAAPARAKQAAAKPLSKATVAKPADVVKRAAGPLGKPAATAKPSVTSNAKAGQPAPRPVPSRPHTPLQTAKAAPAVIKRAMPATVSKPATVKSSPPVTPKDLASKAAEARQSMAAKKSVNQRHGFKTNEYVVYPAHGVGQIVGIEEQEIAGMALELFVITFDKDKMTLRVPTGKLQSVGMRKLANDDVVRKAMETLKGRARIKRTMWSRRAQEYEAKINSGDLVSIAEVVRDLYRSEAQPEQSYSERQLYEAALDRMAREIAAVDKLDDRGAVQRITEVLSKSAKGRRLEGDEAAAGGEIKAA